MEDLFANLNAAQREAVAATEGYVRVIAGAGSGKTGVLARRFAYLVNELGILPGNILCVTFTNKAANEMRRRIHALTGDNDTGYVNTFHGFCVSILQEDGHALQYPKNFLVLDNSDIDAMLQAIYEERGLTLRDMTFSAARDMIEIRKTFREPEYYRDMLRMSRDTLREKYEKAEEAGDIIFYGYLYQEKKCFGLDYNDLIKFSLFLFEENPEIRQKWQERLEYIMIDEFQDIDALQYRLMEVLCGYHRNLFIVGDPDQTIYTWRGARVEYLLNFDKIFTPCHTVMMMRNYRSTPEILNVANSLISRNRDRIRKDLIPCRESGSMPVCHYAPSADEEAGWIADRILSYRAEGIPFRDVSILYRAHYVTRAVEEALIRKKIPYVIYSGTQFFSRMEIKDALCYLRMAVYRDDLSFLRIVNKPKRNLGERRIAWLKEYQEKNGGTLYEALKRNLGEGIFRGTGAAEFVRLIEREAAEYAGKPVSETLAELVDQSGYEKALRTEGSQERLDNLAELRQSVYDYETSCGEECTAENYLVHAAMFTNTDIEETGDRVKLMTIHTAKGLEFPCVILCGMNEGIFPSRKVKTRQGMEEERRLAFVALTRAKDRLCMTEASGRNFDGMPRYPSRFILDIDAGLLEFTHKPSEEEMAEARAYIRSSEQRLREGTEEEHLAPGTRIMHRVFGEGVIEALDLDREAYLVRFAQIRTPRAISFRARLEKAEGSGQTPQPPGGGSA